MQILVIRHDEDEVRFRDIGNGANDSGRTRQSEQYLGWVHCETLEEVQ